MTRSLTHNQISYKQKVDEQEILLRLSQGIIGTLDYDEVLQVISDGMAELLGIETAAIYLLQDEKTLYLGATTPALEAGMPDQLRVALVKDHPNIRRAINSCDLVVIRDTKKAKLSEAEKIVVEMRHLRSLIFLPILREKSVLGVLILGTKSDSRSFSDYELNLSQNVANQLSIAIQNAKLHADLAATNKKLRKEISDHRKTESALKKSEVHLSNALRIAKLGHWEYDVESDMFTFTDEFYELFKTSAEKEGGYEMSSAEYAKRFMYPPDQYLLEYEINNVLNSKDPDYSNEIEHRIVYRDGQIGYIVVRNRVLLDQNGHIKKIYGANQDITKNKKAEELLIDALEKAKESDRLKTAFFANLSHEIRTPMNAIIGFTNLLKEYNIGDDEASEYLELIEKGSQRLLRIITDIVDISRIDAQLFTLKEECAVLNELLDEVSRQYSIQLESGSPELVVSKALPDEESYIRTDVVRLSQVLSNLLENAIKYTHEGFVELGYVMEDNTPLFFVRDTGIGIAEKDRERIFERFTKLERGDRKLNPGTGLGLSIVKSIVELMNGKIWLESEPGKGSVFYFSLPSIMDNRQPEKKQENRKIVSGAAKGGTILIAEDEPLNFRYLEALFDKTQYRIIHAVNGKEALDEYYRNPEIDLVLMDVKMPVMDGIEASGHIRKENSDIPIIAQTAYTFSDEISAALAAGCNETITKPITRKSLAEVIEKYLR